MIDFIRLRKELQDGEIPCLDNLIDGKKYDFRGKYYYIENFTRMLLIYNADNAVIEISGSLPYYIQGHNITFSMDKFIEAVNNIGEKLHLDIWDSSVIELEFGVVLKVERSPKTYIMNHSYRKGEILEEDSKQRDKGKFKWWTDSKSKIVIKMYDAASNLKKKSKINIKNITGINPESKYLKVEIHYNKPHIALNNGRDIKLSYLLLPSWIDRLKEDLLLQYGRLIGVTNLSPPTNKKEATTTSWAIRMVYKTGLANGKSLNSIKLEFYEELREYDVLNINDRKSRQAQFRNIYKKMRYESYDLTEKIIQALNKNDFTKH